MEFEYVVKRQEKSRICFGSGVERKTLESDTAGLYSRHARHNIKENLEMIMPGMYEPSVLTSAFGPLLNRPTSVLGTVMGGRTDFKKKTYATIAPAPGTYDIPTMFPRIFRQNKAPFNVKTSREKSVASTTPGAGQYEVSIPKGRSIPFLHSFGGKKTVLPAVRMKCGPFNFDTCERCSEAPEGDYWSLDLIEARRPQKKKGSGKADIIKEGIFLCRPCYNIEKVENKIFNKLQMRAFKHLSKKPVRCDIRLRWVALGQMEKFKYLGVWFTSDGRTNREISSRIAQAGEVMQQLGRSVVRRAGLSRQAKLSVFRYVYVPVLTYDHEEKIRNCSKVHFHDGCKGKLYLVPQEEIKKLSVREGYLSLFYTSTN